VIHSARVMCESVMAAAAVVDRAAMTATTNFAVFMVPPTSVEGASCPGAYYCTMDSVDQFKPGALWAADRNQLENYWKRGKGALKIRWGTPGDWRRCFKHIKKHVNDEFAKRICSQWHHDVLGTWPGEKSKGH
jgi:hypothetical protein